MNLSQQPWPQSGVPAATLTRLDLVELPGMETGGFGAALAVFCASARALAQALPAGRPGVAAGDALLAAGARALQLPQEAPEAQARSFFASHFSAWHVTPLAGRGFVTGYYEPELAGSRVRSAEFSAPVLSRPADLVTFPPKGTPEGIDQTLAAARLLPDGGLAPYATRAQIEAQAPPGCEPLVWLRDHVELFLMQVQGSARVRLPDGQTLRLGYAGRNGHPYVSIGRWLINQGHIAERDMTLARLKQWLRENGEAGRRVMQLNPSYIFFKIVEGLDPALGPVAAASVQLTPLRSIAVDRTLWPYGLPFWIDAALPWQGGAAEPFQRLMIAQDTGSAIVGPARADIFFGTGDAAGERAGDIRHAAAMYVLLPNAPPAP